MPVLFKWKTKVETKRALPVLNTGESKLYSKKGELLEVPDFIFILVLFLFIIFFLFIYFLFCNGKVDMMGNLAGWRHE